MPSPSTTHKAPSRPSSAFAAATSNPTPHTTTNPTTGPSSMSSSSSKSRQYAHLHSQLAQLNAHLADTENLVRMTAVQAQDIRFLGGYVGALFMGSAKVLGEESLRQGQGQGQGRGKEAAGGDGETSKIGEQQRR
ncbi:hypothetical protein EPUS_07583 [Endocarpon pusillum Z07020]|uniref:High osmolarity sensitivity protein 3 n=1 Tax=Endocarpon pusillum (strain Z07020 / HMAS-L-300199) TaxID=1263415 RepID=U1FXY1_ENDPU|nr:uncharacterized protein EPUS_07583 [Endocarpon pusillum Z07020]ERF69757.1 hypothetical protein EPUS_07583 [Endocarpon pusillum Z07020]